MVGDKPGKGGSEHIERFCTVNLTVKTLSALNNLLTSLLKGFKAKVWNLSSPC